MDAPTSTRLRTPRAAGTAGVLFAVLVAAAIVLVRTAIPSGSPAEAAVPADRRWAVRLALEIVPFAGIFFLWFMGALREHSGEVEDRFFATVFLGSGFIFVSTLFVSAAAAGTVLSEAGSPSGFGRPFAYTVLSTYALRVAAVFVFSTSAIGRRLRVFPRPLALLGFATGLALLVLGSGVPWVEIVFPFWVLVVSLHILRAGLHRTS